MPATMWAIPNGIWKKVSKLTQIKLQLESLSTPTGVFQYSLRNTPVLLKEYYIGFTTSTRNPSALMMR